MYKLPMQCSQTDQCLRLQRLHENDGCKVPVISPSYLQRDKLFVAAEMKGGEVDIGLGRKQHTRLMALMEVTFSFGLYLSRVLDSG